MLWKHYVFRRGRAVFELWDELFRSRVASPVLVVGCGFDLRAKAVLKAFLDSVKAGRYAFKAPKLVLIEYTGYELEPELQQLTASNKEELRREFEPYGDVSVISVQLAGGDEFRATHALREASQSLLGYLEGRTDILLDVSSLPRVLYLTLLTGTLAKLIPNANDTDATPSSHVNFQVLVAEDSELDSQIKPEDPGENLITIPGFGGGFNVESMGEWPVVWFPLLGEGRSSQLEKIRRHAPIPDGAEICPVIPHPSRNPRRGDELLLEYRQLLDSQAISLSNIVLAHESNPFECYRQLFGAIDRYRRSLAPLGGSRLLVTPLASKLMTIGAGLAAFESRPPETSQEYVIGIPYASPTRYLAQVESLKKSRPEIAAVLLTGMAYSS